VRRITDQPVIDNINRLNDDEHECELRGHTDRDDWPVSITYGHVRSDVRENRQGTTLTLTIKVVNVNSACAAVSGADVEIWHVGLRPATTRSTDRRPPRRFSAASRRPTPPAR
jgi:hypothetical protein